MNLLEALETAIQHVDLQEVDQATVELARAYADEIDTYPRAIRSTGWRYLDALESLGLTPRSRGVKEVPASASTSPLDQLKAKRAARVTDTAS